MAIKVFGSVSVRILADSARTRRKSNGLLEGECSFEAIGVQSSAGAVLRAAVRIGEAHPFNSAMWCEEQDITYTSKGAVLRATYAGAEYTSFDKPVYELVVGMQEAPIETHPEFESFAGSPGSALNGALFIDPETGAPSGAPTALFDRFLPYDDGDLNPKAGIESFLEPTVTYRESFVRNYLPSASGFGRVTNSVPGPGYPGSEGGRDWLYMGFTYQRRGDPTGQGFVYEVSKEWRLSGRRGWDPDIYGN